MKKKLILPILLGVLSIGGLNSCGGHVHKYTVQNTDATYLVSEADCDSKAVYYYSCECGEKGSETFEHGNALGHDFTNAPYVTDENQHWQVCTKTGCNGTSTKENHGGGVATETEKAVCETCNQVYGEYLPHTHVVSGSYYEVREGLLYLVDICACENGDVTLVDITKPVEVNNEQDLRLIVQEGYDIKLTADIELHELLEVDGVDIQLDLNGKTIKGVWTSEECEEDEYCLIHVINQGHLTIVGNGTITSAEGSYVNTLLCAISSRIDIDSGNFILEEANALIYAQNNEEGTHDSVITINGGYFKNGLAYENVYYTLNLDEADSTDHSKFVVKGGQFYNFNPAESKADTGVTSHIDSELYHVVETADGNNKVYTVSAHSKSANGDHDETSHWGLCEDCDYRFDVTNHTLTAQYNENGHFEACTCGYSTQVINHDLKGAYNEQGHYQECECGYKTSSVAHTMTATYNYNIKTSTCECGHSTTQEVLSFGFWTNDYSNTDGRKMYIYYWNNSGDSWREMTLVDDNGAFGDYYTLVIDDLKPSDISGFIIVRAKGPNWGQKDAQTADLNYATFLSEWKANPDHTYYI
jgi:hypothetical protein